MAPHRFGIAVHGGAGAAWPDEEPAAARAGCRAAAAVGYTVLARGGNALDAVEAAVAALEDDPQFNAGRGATLTRDGTVELDASIMGGDGLRAGAVAAVRGFANPVRLARRVMERTPHLLLAGPGAEAFARAEGFAEVDPASLITPRARARFEQARAAASPGAFGGTVGAVACDAQGALAAATSTGGTLLKLPGRVGDTPIIGAGTWAQAGLGAASCTGLGEGIVRAGMARAAIEALALGQGGLAACRTAVARLEAAGGSGGLVLIDAEGRPWAWFDTARMAHAFATSDGRAGDGFLPEDRETDGASGT